MRVTFSLFVIIIIISCSSTKQVEKKSINNTIIYFLDQHFKNSNLPIKKVKWSEYNNYEFADSSKSWVSKYGERKFFDDLGRVDSTLKIKKDILSDISNFQYLYKINKDTLTITSRQSYPEQKIRFNHFKYFFQSDTLVKEFLNHKGDLIKDMAAFDKDNRKKYALRITNGKKSKPSIYEYSQFNQDSIIKITWELDPNNINYSRYYDKQNGFFTKQYFYRNNDPNNFSIYNIKKSKGLEKWKIDSYKVTVNDTVLKRSNIGFATYNKFGNLTSYAFGSDTLIKHLQIWKYSDSNNNNALTILDTLKPRFKY